MVSAPLVVFDFDGVIIDGMIEYWTSSRKAVLEILLKNQSYNLPREVPDHFTRLRPWVKNGWEMVLIAAELTKSNSSLILEDPENLSKRYVELRNASLVEWGWKSELLQHSLESIRYHSMSNDLNNWLEQHKSFPNIINFLNRLSIENFEFAVLTTKGEAFTKQLLSHLKIKPHIIFGHESGPKEKIILNLLKTRSICAFIEDRRATLEKILVTPGLESIPCYLAEWGYLKPEDTLNIPVGIELINLETLNLPLGELPFVR